MSTASAPGGQSYPLTLNSLNTPPEISPLALLDAGADPRRLTLLRWKMRWTELRLANDTWRRSYLLDAGSRVPSFTTHVLPGVSATCPIAGIRVRCACCSCAGRMIQAGELHGRFQSGWRNIAMPHGTPYERVERPDDRSDVPRVRLRPARSPSCRMAAIVQVLSGEHGGSATIPSFWHLQADDVERMPSIPSGDEFCHILEAIRKREFPPMDFHTATG